MREARNLHRDLCICGHERSLHIDVEAGIPGQRWFKPVCYGCAGIPSSHEAPHPFQLAVVQPA